MKNNLKYNKLSYNSNKSLNNHRKYTQNLNK